MEQTLLTPSQKAVIQAVAGEPKLDGFYLSGGTALANYYLHHRLSDDLDFFTSADIDSAFLHTFAEKVRAALAAESLRFERLHDRYQFFMKLDQGEFKIEFTRYPFVRLEPPNQFDGIKIDSFRDLAANKLMAILDRFDPKDFVDLFFILQSVPLRKIRADVLKKFGHQVGVVFLGGELAKVRRIAALPKMLKPLTLDELKSFFADVSKELEPEIF